MKKMIVPFLVLLCFCNSEKNNPVSTSTKDTVYVFHTDTLKIFYRDTTNDKNIFTIGGFLDSSDHSTCPTCSGGDFILGRWIIRFNPLKIDSSWYRDIKFSRDNSHWISVDSVSHFKSTIVGQPNLINWQADSLIIWDNYFQLLGFNYLVTLIKPDSSIRIKP
jgi:hypothetical protein